MGVDKWSKKMYAQYAKSTPEHRIPILYGKAKLETNPREQHYADAQNMLSFHKQEIYQRAIGLHCFFFRIYATVDI